MKKLQAFDLSYFVGESYFYNDWLENCLMFQPVFKYFQSFSDTVDRILGWKSKGLSEESATTPATSDNSLLQNLLIFIIPK